MISIIIPAYNEEKRITESLKRVANYMNEKGWEYEIIVVDDGSTDQTLAVVDGARPKIRHIKLISYPTNMGKGFAVRIGVLESKGDIVLISDADLSTPIEEIEKLLPFIDISKGGKCAVAIGSRALPESQIIIKQPLWRQFMGKVFNKIVRILVINDFVDTQCGFKLFDGESARRIFALAKVNRFAFDVEILLIAKKLGFFIKEVPVKWLNSEQSKVSPVLDSLRMLKDLIKIRLNTLLKKDLTRSNFRV
jgi:dolichyl-phosphate beta-glucosyltransferase